MTTNTTLMDAPQGHIQGSDTTNTKTNTTQKRVSSLAFAISLLIATNSWATDGSTGHIGNTLPSENVSGTNGTGSGNGGDGVVILNPSEQENIIAEDLQIEAGMGGDITGEDAEDGRGESAQSGSGGNGLIFENQAKDKNLTISQGVNIISGSGGYATGGEGQQGGNAQAGNGGDISFTGKNLTNNGYLIGGGGGSANGGIGEKVSGNAITGHGGSFIFTGNDLNNTGSISAGTGGTADSSSILGNSGHVTSGHSGGIIFKGQDFISSGELIAGSGGSAITYSNTGNSGNANAGSAIGISFNGKDFISNNVIILGIGGYAYTQGTTGAGNAIAGNNEGFKFIGRDLTTDSYIDMGYSGSAHSTAKTGNTGDAIGGKHHGISFTGRDLINAGYIHGGGSGQAVSETLSGNTGDAISQDAAGISFNGRNLINSGNIQLGSAGYATTSSQTGKAGNAIAGNGGSLIFTGEKLENSQSTISMGNGGYAVVSTETGTTGDAIAGHGGQLVFNGNEFINGGYIQGGMGGEANAETNEISSTSSSIAGNGGGIVFNGKTFFNDIYGTIMGGMGGSANSTIGNTIAGNGGHGLSVEQDNATITNLGTITGGDGGTGATTNGKAGVGVLVNSNNNTIINGGTIQAGTEYDADGTDKMGNAIQVDGNNNNLKFQGNSAIVGHVVIGGANNTIAGNTSIEGMLNLGGKNIIDANSDIKVADTVTLDNGAALNISSIDAESETKVFLTSEKAIEGELATMIGGSAGQSDYLSTYTQKINGDKQYQVTYGLSWFANDAAVSTGNFTLKNKTDFFTVNTDLITMVSPNAAWDGDSLNKKGEGTLVLNGVNTYTGLTNVENGSLVVGGSADKSNAQVAGDVDVQNGASLAGHGSILGHTTINSGATVSAGFGNETGTLTTGSIDFSDGSFYQVKINSDGSNDKIVASSSNGGSGVATINGGNVAAMAQAGGWNTSQTYTILSAENGVNGEFNGVTSNLAFLTPELSYDPDNVYLTVSRNDTVFSSVATTYNQRGTASAIESLNQNSPVYNAILGMDVAGARGAYDNLSGEIYASTKSAVVQNSRYVRDALNSRLITKDPKENLWFSSWGHQGNIRSDGNAATISNSGGGFLVGVDTHISDKTVVGAALGYENTDVGIGNGRDSKAKLDSAHFNVYGGTQVNKFDFRAGLGYSHVTGDVSRDIWVDTLNGKNKAKYKADVYQGFVEGSRSFQVTPKATVTPYANVAHVQVQSKTAKEKTSSTALKAKKQTDNVTYSTVGVKTKIAAGKNDKVSLYGDLGWQHALNGKTVNSRMAFREGSSTYKVRAPIEQNSAIVGAGVNVKLTPKTDLSLGYQGEFGKKKTDNGATLRLSYKF